jgi:hypothetical protein
MSIVRRRVQIGATAMALLFVVMGTSSVLGQSLADSARQNGGSATNVIDIDAPVTHPAEAMSLSDLVMHGRVIDLKVRLSSDESSVVTEYTIAPIQAFKERRVTSVAIPGVVPKIIVQRSGGSLVTADGLRLSTSINIYPEAECFVLGEEVVVFLTYHSDTGLYSLSAGEFSAFRIRDGKVSPMTMEVAARRHVQPIEASLFFRDLQRMR